VRHSEAQDFKSRRTSKNVLDIRFSAVFLAVATGHTDVVVAGIAVTVLVLKAPLGVKGGSRIGTFFTQQCGTWTTAINTLKKKTAYTKEVSVISSAYPPQQWKYQQEYQHQHEYSMNSSSLVPMHLNLPFHLDLH
jgi:hypothetical protein